MTKERKPPKTGKYITDDKHFAGVPKIDAPPEEILRALVTPVTEKAKAARARFLANKKR